MADTKQYTRSAAIVVAAGQGLRAGQDVPKQFAIWRGKPVLRHSVERFAEQGFAAIIVAIPEGWEDHTAAALTGFRSVLFVNGGATRQASVREALAHLNDSHLDRVYVHDAARPTVPLAVLDRLSESLDNYDGAIPVLSVVDSLSIDDNGTMAGAADRSVLRRVQTPQAFRLDRLRRAYAAWIDDDDAGDDAQVLYRDGGTIAHVDGDAALKKLTYADDFEGRNGMIGRAAPALRMGMGFDVHRLVEAEELWLGGVRIEHDKGLSGHSDADVVLHALVDAILGAIAAGDIGDHFPPSDPKWKGARSSQFVEHAVRLADAKGYGIGNADVTIICEAPKIGPHRDAMRGSIAAMLRTDIAQVSVKATTTENLGFTGRGEGIAAQAIVTLTSKE
ncbi:MAG: bifunctional 2-C-methyl-D-erythritol 4-phosphate cytidylyltransferase/2-C-methyl-D-erythritol 2,4-cyclodiphosphate synthase [Pontixanthobacter sp.]